MPKFGKVQRENVGALTGRTYPKPQSHYNPVIVISWAQVARFGGRASAERRSHCGIEASGVILLLRHP